MIFSLLLQIIIIHKYDRTSSNARVLHTATWDYFTSTYLYGLPDRFHHSPKSVKDTIMTDINDLVQEFSRTSSDVGASLFAMRRLLEVLQRCSDISEVCFDIISIFGTAVDLADKILQSLTNPNSWNYSAESALDEIEFRDKFKILLDGYRKMLDQSFSRSKDLGDMLRFLPGVVVQKGLSMQGMAKLYRIRPDLMERFIKFTIGPLEQRRAFNASGRFSFYILDDYLSGFLQDKDRSQLYYCDPMLQHISICCHLLSVLEGSDAHDLPSLS